MRPTLKTHTYAHDLNRKDSLPKDAASPPAHYFRLAQTSRKSTPVPLDHHRPGLRTATPARAHPRLHHLQHTTSSSYANPNTIPPKNQLENPAPKICQSSRGGAPRALAKHIPLLDFQPPPQTAPSALLPFPSPDPPARQQIRAAGRLRAPSGTGEASSRKGAIFAAILLAMGLRSHLVRSNGRGALVWWPSSRP